MGILDARMLHAADTGGEAKAGQGLEFFNNGSNSGWRVFRLGLPDDALVGVDSPIQSVLRNVDADVVVNVHKNDTFKG